MKIALGTVQFGMKYGVANKVGYIDDSELNKILITAINNGINTLDTAITYGDSEQRLGALGVNNWSVISKLPEVPENIDNIYEWTRLQILNSVIKLHINQLDGLLLHRPRQLLGQRGSDIYTSLLALKESGIIRKIGISIYDPIELNEILNKFRFDIVQLPLNILDRRMHLCGLIENLQSNGIEVHVRSIFLQGLLLMENATRPAKFNRWNYIWEEWHKWLIENRLTSLEACLRYALSIEGIDRVVVGVDSATQLREILNTAKKPLLNLPKFPKIVDPILINPSMWNTF